MASIVDICEWPKCLAVWLEWPEAEHRLPQAV